MNDQRNKRLGNEPLVGELRAQMEQIAAWAADSGQALSAFSDPSLPLFQKLSEAQKSAVAAGVGQYFTLLSELKAEGVRFDRSLATVWRAISRLALVPPTDLFGFLSEGDVIEIYDLESRQIFRTFNFFSLSTYTLEELFSLPWFELYAREEKIHESYLNAVARLASGQVKGPEIQAVPEHVVTQIRGTRRNRVRIRPSFYSPLFDKSGTIAASLNSFKVIDVWSEGSTAE